MTNTDTLAPEATANAEGSTATLSLVVADRGHVWVGKVGDTAGPFIRVEGARTVRRWGTSNGLNQLANEGPTANTILDDPATVNVRQGAVIAVIPCEPSRWSA